MALHPRRLVPHHYLHGLGHTALFHPLEEYVNPSEIILLTVYCDVYTVGQQSTVGSVCLQPLLGNRHDAAVEVFSLWSGPRLCKTIVVRLRVFYVVRSETI
jgi:hypothetical protein